MSNDISISRFWFFVFSFTVGISILVYIVWGFFQPKPMIVSFLDVGQGDAIFIETPNGNQILIDGGPGRNVVSELGALMDFSDRSLNMVIATHADADHITGLLPVLEQYVVSLFVDPGVRSDTGIDRALVSLLQKQDIPYVVARRGIRFILDAKRGIFLETHLPEQVGLTKDRNEDSIVFRLVYGDTAFVLTGDAVIANEKALVYAGDNLTAQVVKAGHHGSKTSTSDEFIQSVDPEFSVISYGCDNRYGHPHTDVMQILEKHDVEILHTCEMGTITFYSNGKNVWLGK